jgi:hypothetical protein
VITPPRTLGTGRALGGRPFSRGHLYAILKAPIYAGDIPHHGTVHPGLHEAIIDRGTWEQVQAMLSQQAKGQRRGRRSASLSPLGGKVVDPAGRTLNASHACKGARRYRYYVSKPDAPRPSMRIPAVELEGAVGACLAHALDDPVALCARAWFEVQPEELAHLADRQLHWLSGSGSVMEQPCASWSAACGCTRTG